MFAGRWRFLLRVGLLFMFAALLIASVWHPLLERPQFVSRQGPWAQEALGQPLPLRLSSNIGRWTNRFANATTMPAEAEKEEKKDADEVTYVKIFAAGQQIEEFTDPSTPVCSRSEEERGCLVWVSRREQQRSADAKEASETSTLFGNIVTQFEASPATRWGEVQMSSLHLTLQAGTAVGGAAYDVDTLSQWNDTDTTTAERGVARWVSFGFRRRYGVQELQNHFPAESGKTDGDARDTAEARRKKAANGFPPAASFFRSTLNSTDAVKLFGHLYRKRVAEEEERRKKRKEKQSSGGKAAAAALTYGDVFSSRCFWLVEVVYKELDNPSGVVEGRAWSTCGDRVTWDGDAEAFEALVTETNLAAFLVLFTTALPMVAGTLHQIAWMKNSRTRMLRVNPYQLMLTAFMLSLSTYTLSASATYAASPVSRIIGDSKPTFILYGVVFFAEIVLFFTYFSVDREFTNYFQASENARAQGSRRTLLFFILVWIGPSLIVGAGGFSNLWVAGVMASVFWLPQYIHCVTMDGWTGLTGPFILANLSLVLTPILAPLLAPAPWTLPRNHMVASLVGAAVLLIEGGLLLALRLNNGKNLIPGWMAPWRHAYKTTAEAQRAALLESPLCPICRNPLAEGWDEHDELWQTPCHHLFHKSCLERWMQERTECPLCRKLLPEP